MKIIRDEDGSSKKKLVYPDLIHEGMKNFIITTEKGSLKSAAKNSTAILTQYLNRISYDNLKHLDKISETRYTPWLTFLNSTRQTALETPSLFVLPPGQVFYFYKDVVEPRRLNHKDYMVVSLPFRFGTQSYGDNAYHMRLEKDLIYAMLYSLIQQPLFLKTYAKFRDFDKQPILTELDIAALILKMEIGSELTVSYKGSTYSIRKKGYYMFSVSRNICNIEETDIDEVIRALENMSNELGESESLRNRFNELYHRYESRHSRKFFFA